MVPPYHPFIFFKFLIVVTYNDVDALLLHTCSASPGLYFACIARVSSSFNFERFGLFICCIKCVVLSAALSLPPPRSGRIPDVTCFLN